MRVAPETFRLMLSGNDGHGSAFAS
jgi:hypothetical protein